MVNSRRLADLHLRESQRFLARTEQSRQLFHQAEKVMPGGVPMSWMRKWPGPYPLFLSRAQGARFEDVDGHNYLDLCLGDTGSMAGHSPQPTIAAITAQMARGITAMLPTEDAAIVSAELARRFHLPLWQFTLSATDANRHVIRYCRAITGKSKIIIIDRCYHGSVDESFATLDKSGRTISREGNIGAPVSLYQTSRVVEFNDLEGMEAALKNGDVAAILMEPAMTNVGIVLPEAGYLEGVGALAKKYGALWIIDETHTISVGPGGMTAAHSLQPDFFTIGKAIGGGIPTGAFGMTYEVAERIEAITSREVIDTGGIGGTLAGNALSLAAMRATLTEVLTEDNYRVMIELGDRWSDGVESVIGECALPWHVNRLGARGEYLFRSSAPRTGREAAEAGDFALEQYLHLRLLNDGFLLTPFHNMALISPYTTKADVDSHTQAFRAVAQELLSD
jgi:glutamate-1-semialdehyde 2,1-aminomutase